MSDKVYEMYDDYHQAIEKLHNFIKVRDELAEFLKVAPPEKLLENRELLAKMDKQIENSKALLAKEYEAYQVKCRDEEKLDDVKDDVKDRMERFFILVKHRMPEKLDELKAEVFVNWTPEEIEEFENRIAELEATRLEEFIGEKKDNE